MNIEYSEKFDQAKKIFDTCNVLLFRIFIFSLKTVQIYMDERNETDADILWSLKNLSFLRYVYCLFVLIYVISFEVVELCIDNGWENKDTYAWYNLFYKGAALVVYTICDIFMINLAWNM